MYNIFILLLNECIKHIYVQIIISNVGNTFDRKLLITFIYPIHELHLGFENLSLSRFASVEKG